MATARAVTAKHSGRRSSKTQIPTPPSIHVSEDPTKFKFYKHNRKVTAANVKKLITENKRVFNMHNFPIVVNERFEIIDGQHRFEACRINGWPIYYVVQKQRLKNKVMEIMSVNRAGRRHSTNDIIRMQARNKYRAAQELMKIATRFDIPANQIAIMLVDGSKRHEGVREQIQSSSYTLNATAKTMLIKTFEALEASGLPETVARKTAVRKAVFYVYRDCDVTLPEIIKELRGSVKDLPTAKSNPLKLELMERLGFEIE